MATIEDYEYLKNKSPELYSELQKYFDEMEKQEKLRKEIEKDFAEINQNLRRLNKGYLEMMADLSELKNDRNRILRLS